MKELPKRKPNRLNNYDYSANGAYFITICVAERKNLLSDIEGNIVGAIINRPKLTLKEIGIIAEEYIKEIPMHYRYVNVDNYVIMPNHIHILLQINRKFEERAIDNRPYNTDVSTIIKEFKSAVTKKAGQSIWQKSFHDHIIRNENDYEMIWEYIETNPEKWTDDCFYTEG